jgi:hypothetical protein
MRSSNSGFAGALATTSVVLNGRSFNHSAIQSLLQASFLRVSFRNLLLVGDSVGDSIDCLVGEGKRSRYTLSSGGEWESGEPVPALDSEKARSRLDVSTPVSWLEDTGELSRSSTNFEEVMLVGAGEELAREGSLD